VVVVIVVVVVVVVVEVWWWDDGGYGFSGGCNGYGVNDGGVGGGDNGCGSSRKCVQNIPQIQPVDKHFRYNKIIHSPTDDITSFQ